MPKSLADGHTRVALLTTQPADPKAPTVTELEAGVDASCRLSATDYNVTFAASETVEEKELCVEGNAVAFGPSNATIEFTAFRYFDETGAPETGGVEGEVGDALFQATKEKGTRLWIYQRETSKKATEAWAADDETEGFEFITDNPQQVDRTGYIKKRIVGAYQNAWPNCTVAAVTP